MMRSYFYQRFFSWLWCCALPLAGQTDPAIASQIASGEALMLSGNYLKAKVIFAAAAERMSGTVGFSETQLHDIYSRRLETDFLTGDYKGAHRLAQTMLEKLSRTAEEQGQIYFLEGRIATERGEFNAAAEYFERAIKNLGPLSGNARAGLAELLRRQERYDESAKVVTEAAKLLREQQKSLPREVVLGPVEVMVALGNYSEAQVLVESLRSSWSLPLTHPDTIRLRCLAGFIALRQGNIEKAEEEFKGTAGMIEASAGTLSADYTFALGIETSLAQTAAEVGPAKAWIERLTKHLSELSDNPVRRAWVLLALGGHLLARGDAANAQKYLLEAQQKRLSLFGADSIALAEVTVMFALSELQLNRPASAKESIDRANALFQARRVSPNQEYRLKADLALGATLYQLRDFSGAKKPLMRWLGENKLNKDWANSWARELLGDILLTDGQPTESARVLEEALEIENVTHRAGPAGVARISLLLTKARSKAGDSAGAVSTLESLLGSDTTRGFLAVSEQGSAYNLLGDSQTKLGNFTKAAGAYQEALRIFEGILESNDPIVINTLSSAAVALVAAKRFADALPLLSRLLTIRDQSSGPNSAESIAIVNRLADLYFEGGLFAKAAPLFERLIDASIKGKSIGDRKLLLERVGETYKRLGNMKDAARAFDQRARLALDRHAYEEAEDFALRIQGILGSEQSYSLQRASALSIMGDIRAAQNKPPEAEVLYREAVNLAAGDPIIEASSLNGLGRLALKQKDFAKARRELERALDLTSGTASSGKRALEAMIIANLAALNAVAGESAIALDLYSKFLAIESETTNDDPPLIEYLDEVANYYARVPAKSGEVGDIYQRRLRASGRSFGDSSSETAYARYNLAERYEFQKDYPRALEQYREAMRVFETLNGPESDEAATALTGIATSQAKAGELEGAIKTYELLLSIANKTSAAGGRKQSALLNGLAFVYRQIGRHSEARQTFEKISALWAEKGGTEPLWVAASKNVGISFFDEGLLREGVTSFGLLRKAVRKDSENRDSLGEIDVLRTLAQSLIKNGKIKEGEEANRQADLIEKRLAGRK